MHFLVISDIHGRPSDLDWLATHGAVEYLSLGELCGEPSINGAELHAHLFEQGGMERAVLRLREVATNGLFGLGYSAGGTALWRAVKEGLHLIALVCVSSTRLRYESKLMIPTHTFWGELDTHKPSEEWCRTVPSSSVVYKGLGHGFYDEGDESSTLSYRADALVAFGI
jgi:hypothetical protein